MKESIHGKIITRERALEGLGDPRKWEKEKQALMRKFKQKPSRNRRKMNSVALFIIVVCVWLVALAIYFDETNR